MVDSLVELDGNGQDRAQHSAEGEEEGSKTEHFVVDGVAERTEIDLTSKERELRQERGTRA